MIHCLEENLLSRFGIPRVITSDGGKHFFNKLFESEMKKYGIIHKDTTSGQVELANTEIKQILKKAVNPNHKDWSLQLTNEL